MSDSDEPLSAIAEPRADDGVGRAAEQDAPPHKRARGRPSDVLDLEDGPASLIAIIESSGGRWSNPPSRLTAALASKGEVRAPTPDAGPHLIGFAVVSQWCHVVR
jgi:hypothetical protein